ncbi:hypothetical protein TB1_000991 [Malus domestica]
MSIDDFSQISQPWVPQLFSAFQSSANFEWCWNNQPCSLPRSLIPRDHAQVDLQAHYAYKVRDRLRKEVRVPLRKVLELPEVYIPVGFDFVQQSGFRGDEELQGVTWRLLKTLPLFLTFITAPEIQNFQQALEHGFPAAESQLGLRL